MNDPKHDDSAISSAIQATIAASSYQFFTATCAFWMKQIKLEAIVSLVSLVQSAPSTTPARPDPLRVAAQELESVFLSEMLKSAGLGKSPDARGGIGEEQFASFLRDAQAHEMVRAGGLGLSDALYQSLLAAAHARD